MEEWEGLKWVGMRVCGSQVRGARMKNWRWEREGRVDGKWGGRCDGVRWMVLYLSCTICVSTYVVCLWAW